MKSLDAINKVWQPLGLPEADVCLLPQAPLWIDHETLFTALQNQLPWRAETIKMFGKTVMQPRLVAWFGDDHCSYTYSGKTMTPLPWTPLLQQLADEVRTLTSARYNSVLANLYRNERDSMGFHSDDEPELGRNPTIASLSLGQERTLIFKPRHNRTQQAVHVPLRSGSLLLMKGETQQHWHHGINKQTRPCGARINLTFRWVERKG